MFRVLKYLMFYVEETQTFINYDFAQMLHMHFELSQEHNVVSDKPATHSQVTILFPIHSLAQSTVYVPPNVWLTVLAG